MYAKQRTGTISQPSGCLREPGEGGVHQSGEQEELQKRKHFEGEEQIFESFENRWGVDWNNRRVNQQHKQRHYSDADHYDVIITNHNHQYVVCDSGRQSDSRVADVAGSALGFGGGAHR
jgi:hypothetical protein